MKRILVSLPLVLITACSSAKSLSPGELESLLAKEGVVLVDIRSPDKYADGHIEGAVNVEYHKKTFLKEMGRFDRNSEIVLYCGTGLKTGNAVKELSGAGFRRLSVLSEGLDAWKKAGYPAVR